MCVNQSFAQLRNVYFLKNSGAEVKVRDSADFIREVSGPDSGSVLYNVTEVYLNNKTKFSGKTSRIVPLLLEGQCTSFYQSGKKREMANYSKGVRSGDGYEYYPDGKLYVHRQYNPTDSNLNVRVLILDYIDTAGVQQVKDGNGYFVSYNSGFKSVYEEGNIKSGVKEGQWEGNYGSKEHSISFTETFKNGKFISGQSTDEYNKTSNYTIYEAPPQYVGGIEAFYRYLSQNIRYPYQARRNNITGRVICQFVVEKDGSLSGFKVARSPDNELSREALRVLKQSPNWIPGIQHGQPVRVLYTIPINFTLGAAK
jgi:TonB family protein